VSDFSITISGPPSTLRLLLEWNPHFRENGFRELPITAAYNAPHLLLTASGQAENDVSATALVSSTYLSSSTRDDRILIGYSSPRQGYANAGFLLQDACDALMNVPQRWGKLLENARIVVGDDVSEFISVGPLGTSVSGTLQNAFPRAIIRETLAHASSTKPGVSHQDIAIVGMSGRFPGAEDLEGLWKVLEDGLDLHRMVSYCLSLLSLNRHFNTRHDAESNPDRYSSQYKS
jgi:hypothetical protein